MRAHPRSRGENGRERVREDARLGSSPLTRGKLVMTRVCRVFIGLIPAHAGKTTPQSTGWPDPRAHPRSRGENFQTLGSTVSAVGSSPLTRGKPRSSVRSGVTWGLIPAHAGKT